MNEKWIIGAAGGEELKEILSKSVDPPGTIRDFQNKYELKSKNLNCSPALKMLDLLSYQRKDLYKYCLDQVTKKVLSHVVANAHRMPSLEIQNVLLKTFPFIEFPELRNIPIAILSQQQDTPDVFLKKLSENPDIMNQLPFAVKQRIWMVDQHQLAMTSYALVQKCKMAMEVDTLKSWIWEIGHGQNAAYSEMEVFKKDSCVVQEYMKMMHYQDHTQNASSSVAPMSYISNNSMALTNTVQLYHACCDALKMHIKDTAVQDIRYLGFLRLEFINRQQRNKISSASLSSTESTLATMLHRVDDVHDVAWHLEYCVKTGTMTQDKLGEILKSLKSFSKKSKRKAALPIAEEPIVEEVVIQKEVPASVDDTVTKESLLQAIDKFSAIDIRLIFAEPVPLEVPNYHNMIKTPMDLLTMRKKVNNGEYTSLASFQDDFQVMIQNCSTYNDSKTIYYKEGKKLLKKGTDIIEKMRKQLNRLAQKRKYAVTPKDTKRPKVNTVPPKPSIAPSPKLIKVCRAGAYGHELLDVALLLADPLVHVMLVRSILKCITECIGTYKLPSSHSMIPGLLQLLQLGDVHNIKQLGLQYNHAVERERLEFTLMEPDPVTLGDFFPLLARASIMHMRQYASKVADIKLKDGPMTDKCWKESLARCSVRRNITQFYLIQAIRVGNVNIYKSLIEYLVELDEMEDTSSTNAVQDTAFLQSFISALLAHRGSLSMHMRAITIDEFLLPGLKSSSSKSKSLSNYALHFQFSRFLAESSKLSNSDMSESDLKSYALEALRALDATSVPLSHRWLQSEFQPIRAYYTTLFIKFPQLRNELNLPAEEEG